MNDTYGTPNELERLRLLAESNGVLAHAAQCENALLRKALEKAAGELQAAAANLARLTRGTGSVMGQLIVGHPFEERAMDAAMDAIAHVHNLRTRAEPCANQSDSCACTPPRDLGGWQSVAKEMPKPCKAVLASATYAATGKSYTSRAMWVPKFFKSCDDWDYEGDSEYNEENDTEYWPEGWYEWNNHEEMHWRISDPVTHWMPLPQPPTPQAKGGES